MVDKKRLSKGLNRAKKVEEDEKGLRTVEEMKEEDRGFKRALKRLSGFFNRKRK